jgi:putative hemolysin
VGATAAAYGGSTLALDLAPLLRDLGLGRYAEETAFALVVVAITYLSVVLGELVPKSLALHGAEGYALAVSRPLVGVAALMRPLVWLLTTSANLVLRGFRDSTTFMEARHSPEELQQYVEDPPRPARAGPARPGEIASRAFRVQRAAGVGRDGAAAADRGRSTRARRRAVRDAVLARSFARYPCTTGTSKRAGLRAGARGPRRTRGRPAAGARCARAADHFVPDTTPAAAAWKELQRLRTPMALVVLVGAVVGLVDRGSRGGLVGEILSEDDEPPPPIRPDEDGGFVVQGALAVHEVNRALAIRLPSRRPTPSAVYCVAQRGWIRVRASGFAFSGRRRARGARGDARRVLSVRVRLPAQAC